MRRLSARRGPEVPEALRIEAHAVHVAGPHHPLLEPTTLTVASGQVTVVAGEPGHGHTALALALGGRLRPSGGTVLLGGRPDPRRLRRVVALVDVPGVSEPDEVLPLATVVGEELTLAGAPAGRAAAVRWLAARDLADLARTRLVSVPAAVRTLILAELAAARPGVRALILTAPDRHGADPSTWRALADDLAARGLAVVVTCTEPTAAVLREAAVPLGAVPVASTPPANRTPPTNGIPRTNSTPPIDSAPPTDPMPPMNGTPHTNRTSSTNGTSTNGPGPAARCGAGSVMIGDLQGAER